MEGAIVTFTSAAKLLGAKVSVAAASGLVIVPPSVAETSVGGGESPLAVLAVGSGGVDEAEVGAGAPLSAGVAAGLVVATTTLLVPVPDAVPVAVGEVIAGSGVEVTVGAGTSDVPVATVGATGCEAEVAPSASGAPGADVVAGGAGVTVLAGGSCYRRRGSGRRPSVGW